MVTNKGYNADMVRAGFLIRKELKTAVEEYATENCISASAVYNMAVKQFLENEKMKKLLFNNFNQKEFLEQAAEAYAKAQANLNLEINEKLDSQIGA